jgi:hypothetical protein
VFGETELLQEIQQGDLDGVGFRITHMKTLDWAASHDDKFHRIPEIDCFTLTKIVYQLDGNMLQLESVHFSTASIYAVGQILQEKMKAAALY